MCGISGAFSLTGRPIRGLKGRLALMNRLLAHRGPDGAGQWAADDELVGLAHRRLSIIDLTDGAGQPMAGAGGTQLVFNGEIYNHVELRERRRGRYPFRTRSDTECILAAYADRGPACPEDLRGMFAFALWDERRRSLLCARDRFGIKPFYYATVDGVLYFASEIKALLPFLPDIDTDADALAEYLTFQYTLGDQTLFRHVHQLPPAHVLLAVDGKVTIQRYWDVYYNVDLDHSDAYFSRRLEELVQDSVDMHLRSDVPTGAYLSGGVDSSLIAILARRRDAGPAVAFHGKFTTHPGYDESSYARLAADACDIELHEIDITAQDFHDHIAKVIHHLDHPVAGPGSFSQYMASMLAARHVKVVLGGQGGDEIFAGYSRYLIAYFEQCIKAAINGTYANGDFVVTIESIVPNLGVLREYEPLMREAWREGLFGPLDERYLRLIDRSSDITDEVDWSQLDRGRVIAHFQDVFNSRRNVRPGAYLDSMMHFDFKCLLPALLHVEDRMSMAHGLESRVPFLDHPLIEFLATVPAVVKFRGGAAKHLLKQAFGAILPEAISQRRDKMGFPVPLKEWFNGDLREFLQDVFRSERARHRPFMRADAVLAQALAAGRYSRKVWGMLSMELWFQQFHDQGPAWRAMAENVEACGDPVPGAVSGAGSDAAGTGTGAP